MTATQKKWARLKTHFIVAYHNLKKQSKNQVNNIITGVILALIADELHKFFTKFNEGQQKLANSSYSKKTLKELVEACNKKINALDQTVKVLDKKNNQGNQQKYDQNNSNADNRIPKPPVMYCHLCGRSNDPLNVSMNCPNPKPGYKWHATFKRRYGGLEVDFAEA